MFGYVVANAAELTDEQAAVYRGYYCGLCRCIGEKYGSLQRIALNYDMTFLILLLSSLYDGETITEQKRCMIHPLKKHLHITSEATQYAAAMNIALAHYSFLDHWHDEKKAASYGLAALLKKNIPEIRTAYPRQCGAIAASLEQLSQIEQENVQDPDLAANTFGALLGEIFVWKEDHWADILRQAGSALGRYIYLLDAINDLPKDVKKSSYNPLRSRWSDSFRKDNYIVVLRSMLGECTQTLSILPLVDNVDILRNILYSGVWTGFYNNKTQEGGT